MTDSGRTEVGARPLRLAPFRALRYAPGRVADLASVTCPPYDVIGEAGVATWEAIDPHNVVRLILPRPGSAEDRYAHAARDLRHWLRTGILSRDRHAALYVYEHVNGTAMALGLVGAVSLHDPAERVVLPHEDVLPGPVADRTALMAATAAQLEPILLTYDGDGYASDVVDGTVPTPPLLETTTADGATHRIWRLTDPDVLGRIEADLAGRQALIGDGHHRYAAYRALHAGNGLRDDSDGTRAPTSGGTGTARGLSMLVDASRHPLRIASIHRSVSRLSLAQALASAAAVFRVVTPLPAGAEPLTALSEAGHAGTAYVLADGRQWVLIADPDPAAVDAALPPGRSETWRRLDASIACELVLARLWRVADTDDRVAYHHDAADAVDAAHRRDGVALLLNPVRHGDVLAIAARGERMPWKSTSFGPKPRTGLLMRLLTDPPPMPGPAAARH
jgi:uncharacterized protein (DUF1015 family)